jgi:hypothetical protein
MRTGRGRLAAAARLIQTPSVHIGTGGFSASPVSILSYSANCDSLFWWFARRDLGLNVLVSRCF